LNTEAPKITDWIQAISVSIAALSIFFTIFNGRARQGRLKLLFPSSNVDASGRSNNLVNLKFELNGTLINQSASPEGIARIYLYIRSPKHNFYLWNAIPPFVISINGKKMHKGEIYLKSREAVNVKLALDWDVDKSVLDLANQAREGGNVFPWEVIFETSTGWYFRQSGRLVDMETEDHKWSIWQNKRVVNVPQKAIRYHRRELLKSRISFIRRKLLRRLGLL
jgi:hypothetical protein